MTAKTSASHNWEQKSIVIPDYILNEIIQNPSTSSLYITDIGYYSKALNHYRKRWKGIAQYILIYCIDGKGWISINGKNVPVTANQYFIIPANTPHAYASENTDPWSIYWIHFAGDRAEDFLDTSDKALNIMPSHISRIDDRIQLFDEIFLNLEMGYSKENIIYANICLSHFLASFRYLSQYRQIRKTQEKDMVETSIHYMKSHANEKLTLKKLAEQAKLSSSHFSMVFKQKTGMPPLEYLIHLRIQQACQLLDHSEFKVNEIAQQIGYEDPYYFSRIFSKIMGIAPREY